MKKEKYYDAEMEIIRFDNEDIITTSGGDGTGEGGSDDGSETGSEGGGV